MPAVLTPTATQSEEVHRALQLRLGQREPRRRRRCRRRVGRAAFALRRLALLLLARKAADPLRQKSRVANLRVRVKLMILPIIKNWRRFPYDSTFWRSHYLHPHPYRNS
jgi:hypothetical protein